MQFAFGILIANFLVTKNVPNTRFMHWVFLRHGFVFAVIGRAVAMVSLFVGLTTGFAVFGMVFPDHHRVGKNVP